MRGKIIIGGIILALVTAGVGFLAYKITAGVKSVNFQAVEEDALPEEIRSEIIPEYRELERALACIIDDDVYVIVTRGKKPSSGFDLTVDRLAISEEGGKTCLIVYSNFTDPEQDTVISQIITYPVEVVKTDLRKLPDEIELRIGY